MTDRSARGAQDWPVLAGTPGACWEGVGGQVLPCQNVVAACDRFSYPLGTSGLPDTGLKALPPAVRVPYRPLSGNRRTGIEANGAFGRILAWEEDQQ